MTGARRHRGVAGLMAAVLLVAGFGAGGAEVAQADEYPNGSSAGAGYAASVRVRLSGDAAPGGGGTTTLRVRPACWWSPAAGPYTDAKAMLERYDQVTGGVPTRGQLDEYGPRSIWADAARVEADGGDVSWYLAYCRDPADYDRFSTGAVENFNPVPGDMTTFVYYDYQAFDAGTGPPPPLVDPADLAAAAREVMEIPLPQVQRNPRIRAAGAPTLVGLPTWFWVEDPAAVGGATGTRTIRAEVGDVWAQVTASTTGLRLASPAGGASCPPGRATTAYGPRVPSSRACTVEFTRASVSYPKGYPVTASTGWRADWVGSGATGGTLDPLVRSVTVQVPVAEVQNVVTR